MCPGPTSQVVGKEHPAEVRGEWARGGNKSNQYWSAIGPVLVDAVTSTTSFSLLGGQGAVSVAICLCDSGLSSGAKAS